MQHLHRLAMTSIKVPDPVMSLALTPRASDTLPAFMKALSRFQKEDPTFKSIMVWGREPFTTGMLTKCWSCVTQAI
eukprot:scaffold165219_cov21-Tisochrysis_lutea.AAC.1